MKAILRVLFFFLFAFYFLYAVMDYSTHMQDFIKDKEIQLANLCLYYVYQFIKRADLLIPLALLVSTIKVLSTLNANRELVALRVAGLKLHRLMRPFFILAAAGTLFNLAAAEFFLPVSLSYIDKFNHAHFRHSHRGHRREPIHVIHLKDNSKLIYQSYDESKNVFFDLFWVRSSDDIWRIKSLDPNPHQPKGQFIDHLKRNEDGIFEKTESFENRVFKEIKWDPDRPPKGFVPMENRSISDLCRLLFHKKTTTSYEKAQVATQLYFKLIISLLPFLVVLGAAPFCIPYSRGLPVFLIYAVALFGYITFFTGMDAMTILGGNQVLSPFLAIFAPFALCTFLASWKFTKTY
jgi:lipopolysaccharide export system permease protein